MNAHKPIFLNLNYFSKRHFLRHRELLLCCGRSGGCYSKNKDRVVSNNRLFFSLTVLWARSSKATCWRGPCFLWRLPCLFCLLVIAGIPWHSLAYRHITPIWFPLSNGILSVHLSFQISLVL